MRKQLTKLSEPLIRQGLETINKPSAPQWKLVSSANSQHLSVHYQLPTFKSTWILLNNIASHASKLRHHPTITTTYNQIDLEITTHDVGNSITELDLNLAKEIHNEYLKHIQK